MLLTDLCNRHSDTSTRRPPDSRARSLRRRSASAMSTEREPRAIQSAASDHLAAIQPRVETRLTACSSFRRTTCSPPRCNRKEVKGSARRQSLPGVALSAAPRAGDPASDAPCRAPQVPIAEHPAKSQDRFHRSRVNESGFPDPRRLPSTSAPLAAFAEGARHRAHSFAAVSRLPALFRSSRCSRREELDPVGGDGLFTRGRPDRAPLANFCNRNEMRAQSLDRSNPAHRARVASCAAFAAGGQAPFGAQPAEISRARGFSG
jgi:hypothetical protein